VTVPGDLFEFLSIRFNIFLRETRTDMCLKLLFLISLISLFSINMFVCVVVLAHPHLDLSLYV